nr:transposase [uncultured Sutterella sp.]
MDPFHVIQWAGDALNDIRRKTWQELRSIARDLKRLLDDLTRGDDAVPSAGEIEKPQTSIKTNAALTKAVKGALYPLGKDPDNLTGRQAATLQFIADTDPRLYRAYLSKEWLRSSIKLPADEAATELKRWYFKATHSRIPELGRACPQGPAS